MMGVKNFDEMLEWISDNTELLCIETDQNFLFKTNTYKYNDGIVEVLDTSKSIIFTFKNKYGLIHRSNGPAYIEYNNNGEIINLEYYIEGKCHDELEFLVAKTFE